jgi:hypothetical protein
MLANWLIYRSEIRANHLNPNHHTMPVIRWSKHSDATDSVLEMVLPVTRSRGFHEGLREASIGKTGRTSPVLSGFPFIIPAVEMHGQDELSVHIEILAYPCDERSQSCRAGIAEVEIVGGLGTFAPAEDHPSDKSGIVEV